MFASARLSLSSENSAGLAGEQDSLVLGDPAADVTAFAVEAWDSFLHGGFPVDELDVPFRLARLLARLDVDAENILEDIVVAAAPDSQTRRRVDQ